MGEEGGTDTVGGGTGGELVEREGGEREDDEGRTRDLIER